MPQIQVTCDSCGKLGFETFGERAHGPRLLTFFSFRCEYCGAAVEADGQGPLEGVYREIDLEQNGRWRLEFESEERAKVVQLLRPIYGLTAPEMLEAVCSGLQGSFGEIDRAVQVLKKGGLRARQVEQTNGPPSTQH